MCFWGAENRFFLYSSYILPIFVLYSSYIKPSELAGMKRLHERSVLGMCRQGAG